MSADVENEIRGTPEYAAVYALERWRVAQVKKWNDEWAEERQRRIQHLEASFREQAAALDGKADELEALGAKLKSGFEALRAQAAEQDRREAAFAATQVVVAGEHEAALQTAQERSRRLVAEAQARLEVERARSRELEQRIDALGAQKQQHDAASARLNEELLAVQERNAQHAAAMADKDAELMELKRQLAAQRDAAAALRAQLGAATARAAKLEENAQFHRHEAKRVVQRHNRLLEEIFREREEKLRAEREALEHQMMVGGSGAGRGPKKSAVASCVDAAFESGNAPEENQPQQQQQQSAAGAAPQLPLMRSLHNEVQGMSSMIAQLAKSITEQEERERIRDEQTAKLISSAVKEAAVAAASSINDSSVFRRGADDSGGEEYDFEDGDEHDDGEIYVVEEEEQRPAATGRFAPLRSSVNSSSAADVVSNRYVYSPEFYEKRPSGFHSRTAGGAAGKAAAAASSGGLVHSGDNSFESAEGATRPAPRAAMPTFGENKKQHQSSSQARSSASAPAQQQQHQQQPEQQQRRGGATAAYSSSALSRHSQYADVERIPSSAIDYRERIRRQILKSETDRANIAPDDDSVRINDDDDGGDGGFDTSPRVKQHTANNNTTTVLSSLSVPASEDLGQFDAFGAADAAALLGTSPSQRAASNARAIADAVHTLAAEQRQHHNAERGSSSSSSAEEKRLTAIAFLRRLESNREQLLRTGVYKASDRIIVEMDQRIAEYRANIDSGSRMPAVL